MHQKIVAVVDDDLDDLLVVTDALSRFDESVECKIFYTAEDVIESLIDQRDLLPYCIFIDINMPRITGVELLRRLRAHAFLDEVKIVMLSTSISEMDMEKLLAIGANSGFVKPNDEQSYSDIFHSVLNDNIEKVAVKGRRM